MLFNIHRHRAYRFPVLQISMEIRVEGSAINSHLLIIALGITVLSTAQADDHVQIIDAVDLATEQHAVASRDKAHSSVIELSNQSLSPSDNAKGLRIDYQPFDNNFSMSAGSFHHSSKDSQSVRYNNKTYLGVGWKTMVDQARLGVRVDIGAVYENNEGSNLATPAVNSLKSISRSDFDDTATTRWQPVISLGVSYRF
ncbi:hypothetical protein [Endozoicomonas sp. SCSIO W0465]|uniref:hypothetical protein n=1 Tax=Endozoicomonas sp. SCSIO W0465 TaxID=2918516 RepID=UPI002074FBA8|nr:hypothetical protein [Endozoicomonas sp. SCSIO W0465]USE37030.1 hypothetical protein MJO57_01990 [Endozoicomonas sp. SCSIO W0465]